MQGAAKRELRAEMRRLRQAIAADPADRLARSARIWARIVSSADLGALGLTSETQRAQIDGPRVMLFDGLPTEPSTEAWFEWCVGNGIRAFRPETHGPDLRIEPGDLDPRELDVVVVPGLAFTRDGRRLGQGGGHYDRFLPRVRPECLTVGACFHEQLVDDLPTEPHDHRVQLVITDGQPCA